MGNVNEGKEKEGPPSDEYLSESPGSECTLEFEDSECLSSSVLEQDALYSDLPIKLFFPSRPTISDIAIDESAVESTTSFEDPENTIQSNIAYTQANEHDEELPRDDSFPLSDSVLPNSFDLLVETSPILSDGSDIFHTPDNSLDCVEEKFPSSFQSSFNASTNLSSISIDDSINIERALEDALVQPSPPEDAHSTLKEPAEFQRNDDDISSPAQVQVSIEKRVAVDVNQSRELGCEACKNPEDTQSELTQIIFNEHQSDNGHLSPLILRNQMTEVESNNPHSQTCKVIGDSLSNSSQRFTAEHQSVEDLFSRLSLYRFNVTETSNLKKMTGGIPSSPNAQVCMDVKRPLLDLVQIAPIPTEQSRRNEDQFSWLAGGQESCEEPISLNEIQEHPTAEAPEFLSGFSSDCLECEYPTGEVIESFTTSHYQNDVEHGPASDINSPLFLSNFHINLPNFAITPSTTESSSFKTKFNISPSLVTMQPVDNKGGVEDQDRINFKLLESPVTISHLLNISSEPLILASEPNQLSDSFATPFPSKLAIHTITAPLEMQITSLPDPILLEDKSDILIACSSRSETPSWDLEEMIDTAFFDIITPEVVVDMESYEVHGSPLESIDTFEAISVPVEHADVPTVIVSDEGRSLSIISNVEQKEMIEDKTILSNSHEVQIEQPSACFIYPQHSPERPNWALAPIDPPKPQVVPATKLVKAESKRTMSRRGKQKADGVISTRKASKAQTACLSGHSIITPDTPAHSSRASESPSNKSLDGLRSKSSVVISTAQAENARASIQSRSNVESSKPMVPAKSIGRVHRTGSGSVSFRQIELLDKASLSVKGSDIGLPPVSETRKFSKSKETLARAFPTLSDTSFTPGTCENNAEMVKDKIATILLETRRNRSSKAQPPYHLAPPVNPARENSSHKSRVSWPANEQEFQTNGRPPLPPLPWRAGIGRALSFNPVSVHDAQLRSPPAETGDHYRHKLTPERIRSQHVTAKSLQVGYDEFRLHAQEHDSPVRVNLPSPSRPSERKRKLPRSDSDITSYASDRSIFHSHIPVATKIFVNRCVGPESYTALPAAPMTFINTEGWQSSAPFPQAPSVHRISVPNPPDANVSRVGHRYCTAPPPHPYLQNPVRASQPTKTARLQDLANRSSVPNLSAQMHRSDSRASESMPAASGQPPQYRFSAMQRVKSREFLNNAYPQGQYHERKHVESISTNYTGSVAFARNFYPPADALEWRNTQPLRPSDALLQDRHHSMNNPTGALSHGLYAPKQEPQHRNFNSYNNAK